MVIFKYDEDGNHGACFVAGSKVLMADSTWKNIEQVQVGELMYSIDGPAVCIEEEITFLGDRKLLTFAEDESIFWSEDHLFWTINVEDKEWWWSYNPTRVRSQIRAAQNIGLELGLLNNYSIRDETCPVKYAHLDGWKFRQIKSATTNTDEYNENTPLFLPVTSGAPIIVNGYLVCSGVDESKFDYTAIKWAEVVSRYNAEQRIQIESTI
jgi:hypothetical protein